MSQSADERLVVMLEARIYQEQLVERFVSEREKQLKVTAALAAGLRIAEGVSSLPITVGDLTHDRLRSGCCGGNRWRAL